MTRIGLISTKPSAIRSTPCMRFWVDFVVAVSPLTTRVSVEREGIPMRLLKIEDAIQKIADLQRDPAALDVGNIRSTSAPAWPLARRIIF